jgi:hypothetical protein
LIKALCTYYWLGNILTFKKVMDIILYFLHSENALQGVLVPLEQFWFKKALWLIMG